MTPATPAYERITERRGAAMSSSQIAMANTRYRFAAEQSAGADVLEIGCGTGFGLEFVRRSAKRAVGGDINESNLGAAASAGLAVARFDAHRLPFGDATVDCVLLFESIYYLRDPDHALAEMHRVLRDDGTLLICLPNRERPGFHPSPFSVSYPSATELDRLLRGAGFDPQMFAAFPIGQGGTVERLYLAAATTAVRLRIIPRTLEGRARLKRILFGRLPVFDGIDGTTGVQPLERIDPAKPVRDYVNLYALARKTR